MTGTWPLGWATGDVEVAAQYGKGIGAISDTTLGGSAASIDITGIVASYAHLLLVAYARVDDAGTIGSFNLRFNADAGANYDSQIIRGKAAAATAGEGFALTAAPVADVPAVSAGANLFGAAVVLIPHYSGTANNKSFVSANSQKSGTATTNMEAMVDVGFWRSNAAITRVTLLPGSGGNFVAGTRVTLYAMGA